jgi:hypothetical protein
VNGGCPAVGGAVDVANAASRRQIRLEQHVNRFTSWKATRRLAVCQEKSESEGELIDDHIMLLCRGGALVCSVEGE